MYLLQTLVQNIDKPFYIAWVMRTFVVLMIGYSLTIIN